MIPVDAGGIMGFFKAYDMRGTFGADFDLDTVYKVGLSLPAALERANGGVSRRPRVLIGRDARATSPAIASALKAGLSRAGAEVEDMGLATTPMVYFFTAEDSFDGSVMITASHNPPSDNGLKVSSRGALPMGRDSGLADVEREVASRGDVLPSRLPDARQGTDPERLRRYVEFLRRDAPDLSSLRFAVDCSDGMASILARELFPGAVLLNAVPDGTFPHHSPNPLLPESRVALSDAVRSGALDCGVMFDGDADRCVFVDGDGEFVAPDLLIPILAETYPVRSGRIIHDVRTSRAVIERLREDGFEPVMGKVGHAYAKVLLRETGAICGGELAGHYYFRDFHFCDSGELAALRILGAFAAAKAEGSSVDGRLACVRGRYSNSGEINFRVEDKDAAVARILETAAGLARETSRCDIDGVRLEFEEGWLSVRRSNTEPYLRLIVETRRVEDLKRWVDALSRAAVGKESK